MNFKMSVFLLLATSAVAAPDSAAAEKMAKAFSAAWSRGDAAALAALYAPDAVLTTPDGKTVRGRDAIRDAYAGHLREAKGSKMTFSGHEFRELGAGAMAWRCDWKATGMKGPAATMSGTGLAVLVAEKDGWLIAEDLAALTPPAPKAVKPAHGHEHGPGGHTHTHGDGEHEHDHGHSH